MILSRVTIIDGVLPIYDRAKKLRNPTFWQLGRPEWDGWNVAEDEERDVVAFSKADKYITVPMSRCIIEYSLKDIDIPKRGKK